MVTSSRQRTADKPLRAWLVLWVTGARAMLTTMNRGFGQAFQGLHTFMSCRLRSSNSDGYLEER